MKKENKIFVIAAVAALLVDLLFQQDAVNKISVGNTVLILGVIVLVNLAAHLSATISRKNGASKALRIGAVLAQSRHLFFTGSLFVVWLISLVWSAGVLRQNQTELTAYVGTATIAVGLMTLGVFLFAAYRHREITEDSILLLLLAALAVRIFYVVMTQAHIFQNDTGVLWSPLGGHLGYVNYIFENCALPDFDPTTRHQFYQPPLYYIVTSFWVKLHSIAGISLEAMDENLQAVSLFYSVVSLGLLNKIAIRLNISAWGRFVALGLIAFLPYDIMMSGSLNNDLFMIVWMLLCIYYTLKWYQESGIVNILLMGITIGCAMMTKISAALIAPGIAIIMLTKAWKERQAWKKYLIQFSVFGLAAFPLGLWYPLKNLFQYGVPLGYVPNMGLDSSQFIGMYTGTRRIFEVGDQLEELFLHWDHSLPYIDYNIPISLIKFAVFGEGAYYLINNTVKILGTWTFWIVAVLLITSAFLCVVCLIRRKVAWIYKIAFGVMILVIMGSYVKFCYLYPHVCTMHIRYVMVAVYLAFIAAAAALDPSAEKLNKFAVRLGKGLITLFVFLFAILSVLLNWNMEVLLQ